MGKGNLRGGKCNVNDKASVCESVAGVGVEGRVRGKNNNEEVVLCTIISTDAKSVYKRLIHHDSFSIIVCSSSFPKTKHYALELRGILII